MANYSGKVGPSNGSVYVCNLPPGTDEDMLAEFFGTIGLLKKDKRTGQPKIWLYRDKVTNEPKGDATVTYEDPYAAQAAVEWFNNKDFHGTIIEVLMAESKNAHNLVAPVVEPSLIGDVGVEETARDMSEVVEEVEVVVMLQETLHQRHGNKMGTGCEYKVCDMTLLFKCELCISWCMQSLWKCKTCCCFWRRRRGCWSGQGSWWP